MNFVGLNVSIKTLFIQGIVQGLNAFQGLTRFLRNKMTSSKCAGFPLKMLKNNLKQRFYSCHDSWVMNFKSWFQNTVRVRTCILPFLSFCNLFGIRRLCEIVSARLQTLQALNRYCVRRRVSLLRVYTCVLLKEVVLFYAN